MDKLEEVVRPLYTDAFTVGKDAAAVMERVLADDFQSIGSVDKKTKQQLIGQIKFFHGLVPDLRWEIQECVAAGNKVVVRSVASGTPKGNFMGVPATGERRFEIMTIDIHTVEGGRVRSVHHLEDWATALKQLAG